MTQNFSVGEKPRGRGWHGHPNSIAALKRHQVQLQDNPRRCRKCRQVAMRGIDLCVMHGGARRVLPDRNGRVERRRLMNLETLGLLPLDLIALPVWRGLIGLPTSERAPMRLALLQAWDRRYLEPLHWAQVQRRALELGAKPGRRQNAAPWYENQ